jgi:8-oxo-dGTP pyrophosphatase MutT (NUDIX family)
VALAFTGLPDDLALCVIQRVIRAGDRWSGQMAFPGGRAEDHDGTPRAVAERETLEEVGLDLAVAEFLGPLDELYIRHSGRVTRDVLSPFGYYAGDCPPELHPCTDEVAAAFWVPVRHIWDPRNWTPFDWSRDGKPVRLPGVAYGGKVIWGLTYMILASLGQSAGAPLPWEAAAR